MTHQKALRPTDHRWDRRRSCRIQRLEEPLDSDEFSSPAVGSIIFSFLLSLALLGGRPRAETQQHISAASGSYLGPRNFLILLGFILAAKY